MKFGEDWTSSFGEDVLRDCGRTEVVYGHNIGPLMTSLPVDLYLLTLRNFYKKFEKIIFEKKNNPNFQITFETKKYVKEIIPKVVSGRGGQMFF